MTFFWLIRRYPAGPQDACLAPWQRASHARGAWASEEKSLWEVARILTGRYSYAHADGGTHAGACLLPGTVDPVLICPVAAEQPPGRQQRHHHHLRVTQRLSSQSFQPGHLTQGGLCTSGPPWCAARDLGGFWRVVDLAQGGVALVHVTCWGRTTHVGEPEDARLQGVGSNTYF